MLENPWVIGIGTGIASSVIFFLINVTLNKINKKEYYSRLDQANREIINLLIMTIAEGNIPDKKVIQSMLNSLSRSFKVKSDDMNTIEETYEDLVKEIFESKFISTENKNLYSKEISLVMIKDAELVSNEMEREVKNTSHETNFNSRSRKVVALISLMLIYIALFSTLAIWSIDNNGFINILESQGNYLLTTFFVSVATMAVLSALLVMRKHNQKREKDKFYWDDKINERKKQQINKE